ncbi:hypothetical protein H5410_027243 [Solanum commersonii]|uniref:Uncharacterized protein n=1 Tax=Solanum commersonii TaxID=4109 RepID=A0A9J5Z1F6_SOLCO|nr:hypothetical protein H5410_027243 [Solanum commersonii]
MNHPMYKEFMDFMKSKKELENNPPSYSSILIDDENIEVFDMNDKKEVILLLEENDLKWRNEPWQIMARYLDRVSYTITVYKYRMHYKIILLSTGCEFQHFYPANTKKVYNFSKLIIKKIITPEEWGMSTLKELDYIHPEQKVAVKYNYWDYIDGFNKVLLYENANRKHSWFIKILKILTESYRKLYLEWVDISPKLIKIQEENIFFEGMSVMYFFMEFSIPWIMKWSIEVNNTSERFPCLQKTFYTKFWSKLLQKNPEGKLHGQEIIDLINVTISKYYDTATTELLVIEDISPFKKITRKLQMKKGLISKSEAIEIYMEEVKKDLIKNLDIDIKDDISMMSASHTNEEEDACIAGEGQDVDEKEIDLETILKLGPHIIRGQKDKINQLKLKVRHNSSSQSMKGHRINLLDYSLDYPCGGRTWADPDSKGFSYIIARMSYVHEGSLSLTERSDFNTVLFMNIIKKKSTVKNSRKEEYNIPQHLDLLNKWTIPKISPRIIYQMGTFEKLGLKQVAFKPLTLRDLPESFIATLRDGRNHNWKKSLIGTIQTSLAYGPDENSLSSRMLNVKLHGYDYIPGTEVVCICYRIYYKLLHTLNPMCKVVTRRPIKWEEINFPQEWVIENATQPQNNFNTEVSEIEQLNDGTVKIRCHEPTNMLIDNRSMSSRISRSNSSYISPVDYIIQVPSRASTSQIRETYRCDNIKIDKDNIVKPIRRVSSDLDITESEMNFPDGITGINRLIAFVPWFMCKHVHNYISMLERDFTLSNGEITKSVFPPQQSFQINKNEKIVNFNAFRNYLKMTLP